MHVGDNNMSSLPRRRTRNQWDEFYRNQWDKSKKRKTSSEGDTRVKTHVIDSPPISHVKQDFEHIHENKLNIHKYGESSRIIRDVGECGTGSGHIKGKGIEGEERVDDVASPGHDPQEEEIFDVITKNDGNDDDVVVFLGEEIGSNGSSDTDKKQKANTVVKTHVVDYEAICPESSGTIRDVEDCGTGSVDIKGKGTEEEERADDVASTGHGSQEEKILDVKSKNDDNDVVFLSEEIGSNDSSNIDKKRETGSESKVGNSSNGVVSCNFNEMLDDENTKVAVDICVDLDSESSGSWESISEEIENDDDDESSDVDYKEDEPLNSDDTDDSNCVSDKDDESESDGSPMNGENDIDFVGYNENDKNGDNTMKKSCNEKHENVGINVIDEKLKFSGVKECPRISGKAESEMEQEKYLIDGGENTHNWTHSNEKWEEMVFIIDDGEKFPGVNENPRFCEKRESGLEQEKVDGDQNTHNGTSSDEKQEEMIIIIDDKVKFPGVNECPRFHEKKESDLEQEKDVIDGDQNTHNGTSTDEKREEMVIIIEDKEKFPVLRKSDRKKRKFGCLEILVDFDKSDVTIKQSRFEKHFRPCPFSDYQKKDPKPEKFTFTDPIHIERMLKMGQQCSKEGMKHWQRKTPSERNNDLIKILVDSLCSLNENVAPIDVNDLIQDSLPFKFSFEDEVVEPPPEKSEWEKEIDLLFLDLELGLRESEIDSDNCDMTENDDIFSTDIDESPEACCGRGEHQLILDEEIGVLCRYCCAVNLEIKYVLPSFYTPPLRRRDWRGFDESPRSNVDQVHIHNSACEPLLDPINYAKGTVWDLIPGVQRNLFPHQREGFEFIWKNIVGDIMIENLKMNDSDDGRGCIISHAPGTGKSRLTIVFLMAFLKLYPKSCPVIVAPRGMLLTWEDEFKKWKVNIPFHQMNKTLSGNEIQFAAEIARQVGSGPTSINSIRLVKLYSWVNGGGVLGISYKLFESLAGFDDKKGENERKLRNILLKKPGLLVLDEGHTPRNEKSRIWNALIEVSTKKRIILSGTPFQNNFRELKNTFHLVNPISQKKWRTLIGNDKNGVKRLRAMLDPFVHLHKGTILQKRLPGLRDTIVCLRPTELQKSLLKDATKDREFWRRTRLVSLVSVHPSMVANEKAFLAHKDTLEKIESDIDAGVKIKFVMMIISLASACNERVLVFSQYIDPLVFIKKQLKTHFSWNEGREVLYMDGQLDEKQRQESISSLNDYSSNAKVLLASERACSEGINLVGASRVVLLDTAWNPSVERQAISRSYRLGQKKVVHVYRLIISGADIRPYELQAKKDRISQLIFSPIDGQANKNDETLPFVVSDDKVLETMTNLKSCGHIFEKIIHQPKESDLIETFGFVDL